MFSILLKHDYPCEDHAFFPLSQVIALLKYIILFMFRCLSRHGKHFLNCVCTSSRDQWGSPYCQSDSPTTCENGCESGISCFRHVGRSVGVNSNYIAVSFCQETLDFPPALSTTKGTCPWLVWIYWCSGLLGLLIMTQLTNQECTASANEQGTLESFHCMLLYTFYKRKLLYSFTKEHSFDI